MKLLGDLLVGAKALTTEQREKALQHQKAQKGGRFGTALMEIGVLPEELLLRALSVQRQVPPASALDLSEIRPDILRLVPAKLAARLHAIPFRRIGRDLLLAMRDPSDLPAVDEVSFLTGLPIKPHVALEFRLQLALAKHYNLDPGERNQRIAKKLDQAREAAQAPAPPPAPTPESRVAPRTMSGAFVRPPAPPPVLPAPPAPPVHAPRSDVTLSGVFAIGGGDPWGMESEDHAQAAPTLHTETFGASASAPAPAAVAPPVPRAPAPAPPGPAPAPVVAAKVESPRELDDDDVRKLRGEVIPEEPEPTAVLSAVLSEEAPLAEASEVESAGEEVLIAEEAPPETPESFDLIQRLSAAESRDDVADAVLTAATASLKRAAFFIAQADRVIGWAARPEPPDGLRSFSLPYAEPSMFASLRNTEGFYVGPCPDLPANRKIMAALGQTDRVHVAVIPISLKGKSVLFFVGEPQDPASAPSVPELKRLATMTATAFEILLLKNRLRQL
ncbi:MAG: hypothetical protein ABIT01_09650 [Thermoanaerobaculia bacterium]